VRFRPVLFIDALIVLAVVAIVVIVLSGGFFTRSEGVRISARSPDRALFLAVGLLVVRLALDRRTPFLGLAGATWKRLQDRAYDPGADARREGDGRVRGRHSLAAALGICAVGAVLLYPQLSDMHAVPDLGDPLFSIWRMAWIYRQLLGDPRPLFDANIFHPEPLTLTYSDSILLPSLTAAPLFAIGLHPLAIYNVMFVSSFFLSAMATYALVVRWTGSPRAAFISALVFGFYPYRFEHYSHLELQMTHWMPLALLAIDRFTRSLRLRDAVLAALCWTAQLYSSLYYGVFFGLYGAVVAVVLCVTRGVRVRQITRPVLAGGALAAVLTVPLAIPYVGAQARKGSRDVASVTALSAEPADYLRADLRSARYGTMTLPGRKPERALFPGVTPLVFSGAGIIPPIGPARLASLAGLLLAFDGSLGFNGVSYPLLYEWVLPIRGLRVPARFSILVGLSLAILSGFGARRLLRRYEGWTGQTVFGLFIVAIAADVQPILRVRPVWSDPPPVYASLAGRPDVVLAEFPFPRELADLDDNLIYMYFSVWHGTALVNGYSGFFPPDYTGVARSLAGFPDADALRLLKQRGVTHITVNCAFYGNRCETVLDTLESMPDVRAVVQARWGGRPVHLYELHGSSPVRLNSASSR
jgi:hypothetical protein